MGFCRASEHQLVVCAEPGPPCGGRVTADLAEGPSFPERSSRPWSAAEAVSRDGRGAIPATSQMVPGGCHGSSIPPQNRQTTPEVDIPWLSKPSGDAFLVPSSCKSICKNYSDLLIGGDQVLPLSASADAWEAHASPQLPSGPFLQSSEIPPPADGKDRSFLFQGGRPLSNSQLNAYLEQKLLDLYRQYMVESLVQNGSPSAVLASQLILTSVDQITLQLSREQNLEAAKAKDMVISCLLRVASELPPSGEISTPSAPDLR
ncbi:hypothetical protein SKAU_G00254680 [Synaphobranchus kaupii]|uniref:Uncharacterized protein n=1 Tax=Synaphobranchus kaupii TaxID=118154 RepID=A0A9Q1F3I0_SYNKA|nr:hypothetical protein SKAU_G00254680 [Synaphobranchus kaupii]